MSLLMPMILFLRYYICFLFSVDSDSTNREPNCYFAVSALLWSISFLSNVLFWFNLSIWKTLLWISSVLPVILFCDLRLLIQVLFFFLRDRLVQIGVYLVSFLVHLKFHLVHCFSNLDWCSSRFFCFSFNSSSCSLSLFFFYSNSYSFSSHVSSCSSF